MVGAPSYQEIGAESPTLMGAPKFDTLVSQDMASPRTVTPGELLS